MSVSIRAAKHPAPGETLGDVPGALIPYIVLAPKTAGQQVTAPDSAETPDGDHTGWLVVIYRLIYYQAS